MSGVPVTHISTAIKDNLVYQTGKESCCGQVAGISLAFGLDGSISPRLLVFISFVMEECIGGVISTGGHEL
jgi:hypothetical protein